MAYRTVFDVTQIGFQWWIPVLIFLFASVFALIGWGLRTSGDRDSSEKGWIFQVIGAVGILTASGWCAASYGEYYAARKALATHDYSVVEGTISNFVPMPAGGHALESFVVNRVRFEYGSGWGSTAFNSDWNKGFIHNGVEARITYSGKDILRVEVR